MEHFLLVKIKLLNLGDSMFSISNSYNLMSEALNYRALRQKIISSNIANIDTPFYRAKDIDFESTLLKKAKRAFDNDDKKLKMAITDKKHLKGILDLEDKKPTIFFRDGHLARNDANTVDLDVETTEMSKNSIMFNALTSALKRDSLLFKAVIDASSKV